MTRQVVEEEDDGGDDAASGGAVAPLFDPPAPGLDGANADSNSEFKSGDVDVANDDDDDDDDDVVSSDDGNRTSTIVAALQMKSRSRTSTFVPFRGYEEEEDEEEDDEG